MAAKTESKAAEKMEAKMTSLLDQATQTFGDALKAGVKIQEEIARWWGDALDQAGPMYELQKRSRAIVTEAIPAAQKNAEEWLRLVEQNYRRSMDLVKKAFSANGDSDIQARTQGLWEASLDVMRDNAQAVAQTNVKMMDLWADLLQRNLQEAQAMAKSAAAK